MDQVQKDALKALLHHIVDTEELQIVKDMLAKLPPNYAVIAQGIATAVAPIVQGLEHKVIDAI